MPELPTVACPCGCRRGSKLAQRSPFKARCDTLSTACVHLSNANQVTNQDIGPSRSALAMPPVCSLPA
eukprot:6246824-Pyramimonas_sp.AAC.1